MLSAIVIAKNEEDTLDGCIKSLLFADEVIVVNNNSTDNTLKVAKRNKARVINFSGVGYDLARNHGLSYATHDWIFYLDADERVSQDLKKTLQKITSKSRTDFSVYKIARKNIYLGKELKYGGWGNDFVIRLFRKTKLLGWESHLHEQPKFSGDMGKIEDPIIHYSHRDLYSMTEKTIFFTNFEAQNRIQVKHPPVVVWRIIRVMLTEFYIRFIKLTAWKDGSEGIIDGLFQVFNSFIIYSRLWELQDEQKSLHL